MPRVTLIEWFCWLGHQNDGSRKDCQECGALRIEKHAQIHVHDRAVVYRHPVTGEHITPARADQPMPEVYRERGFERHEILSMTHYERESGTVHEASNFNPGNEPSPLNDPPAPQISKETRDSLIEDMREAFASGPFTGGDTLE